MSAVKETRVHPQAIISDGAELDTGVEIGPFAVIGPKVQLGADTVVHSHAVISGKTSIGAKNIVFNGAVLGNDPQDLKYSGEDTELLIGEGNTFREFCTVHKGSVDGGGTTQIGDNNLLMAYCHIAHDCQVQNGNVLANGVQLGGHVHIGSLAVIGGLSGIHQFCRVGDMTMVAASALVTQDVPPYCLVQGDRARLIGLNLVGLKRRGISQENIDVLKKAFRLIFRSGRSLETAIGSVTDSLDKTEEVASLIQFLSYSKRGFVR